MGMERRQGEVERRDMIIFCSGASKEVEGEFCLLINFSFVGIPRE